MGDVRLPSSREPAGRFIYNGGVIAAAGVLGFLLDFGIVVNWILIVVGAAMIVRGLFYLRAGQD